MFKNNIILFELGQKKKVDLTAPGSFKIQCGMQSFTVFFIF